MPQVISEVDDILQSASAAALKTNLLAAAEAAPIASPTFTGEPASTTPDNDDSSTRIATTAFVAALVRDSQKIRFGVFQISGLLTAGSFVSEPFTINLTDQIFIYRPSGAYVVAINIPGVTATISPTFDSNMVEFNMSLAGDGFDEYTVVATGDAGVRNPEKVTTWTPSAGTAAIEITSVVIDDIEKNPAIEP